MSKPANAFCQALAFRNRVICNDFKHFTDRCKISFDTGLMHAPPKARPFVNNRCCEIFNASRSAESKSRKRLPSLFVSMWSTF